MSNLQLQGAESNPFFLPNEGAFHQPFSLGSQEPHIFHIPFSVASCAFSYLPFFCLQLLLDTFCPDLAVLRLLLLKCREE